MLKLILVLALAGWLAFRFKVALSRLWISLVEPALDRVGDRAADVVHRSVAKEGERPLSKKQAEDLRR